MAREFPPVMRAHDSACRKVTSQCDAGPWLGSGAGWPGSFLPLKMRGVTRREDALSGLRRTARTITPGGPGSPDPGASADAPRQLGAPRGIYRFRVHGQSDRPAVFVPRGGFPSAARGRDVCGVTLAGAASRPTLTTSRDDAPRWTGRI